MPSPFSCNAKVGTLLFAASLLCGPSCIAQQASLLEVDNAHCGKKFRIATHVAPPFIMIDDATKCVDQKCGPGAFGSNGGIVYKLMMDHVLPQLRKYCKVYQPRLPHSFAICTTLFMLVSCPSLGTCWPCPPFGIDYQNKITRRAAIRSTSTLNGTYLLSL
jgi:hypothetical protein